MKAHIDNDAYNVVINEEFKNATIHTELNKSDLALWNSDTDQHSLQLMHLLWNDLTVRQQKAHHLIPEKMLKRLVIQWIRYSLDMPSHCMPNASNPTSFRNLLPASPLNDMQKQISLAQQRWGVDPATYLDSLKHLSKLRWHTTERYNIILYALFLRTTTINYKWIEKESGAISLQRISRKPRSIYMTTDNCIPTSIYKNENKQRYVSRRQDDLYKLGKKNSRDKIQVKKFANFQNGTSRKQYRNVDGQKIEVTSIPTEMPIISDSINTSQIIFAPSRELICFAYQLIQDYQKESIDIPCSDREPTAQGLSHEEMIAVELLKKEMGMEQINQWATENLPPHDRVSTELTCTCSSRLTCTCQSLRGPHAAEDKSSDTE